jgi:putative flavoprotein involved in K+ transport
MGSVRNRDSEFWEAIVIGAGSAGLSTSFSLKQLGIEHIVLERGQVANSWARERWDSFRLNTPNSYFRLPGSPYDGPDPDGFLARDEVVDFMAAYAQRFDLPMQDQTEVLQAYAAGNEWHLRTNRGSFVTRNLVVAAGAFAAPKFPLQAANLAPDVVQVHTSGYRNPSQLPPGAVLVVGTGQSGVQVAEDLLNKRRQVYLCVGRCPRIPRRYRGRDAIVWLDHIGFLDQRAKDLASPRDRDMCHPQIAGRGEPPDVNVRYLASRGAVLLGHFRDARGMAIEVADNVADSLRSADEVSRELLDKIDAYIAENNLSMPPADPAARDFTLPRIDHRTALDLRAEGISSVVWATGFHHGFPWLHGCPHDEDGYPAHEEGVAAVPGLYFVGLHFLRARKSGLLVGVGEDAQRIARAVGAHARAQSPRELSRGYNGHRHGTPLESVRVDLGSEVEEIDFDEIEMLDAAEPLPGDIDFETAFEALTTIRPLPEAEGQVADTSRSKPGRPSQPISRPPRLMTRPGLGEPEKATGRAQSDKPDAPNRPARLEKLERENARLAREIEKLRRNTGGGFARERELLNLRELINKKDKEILDLRDQIGSRDRRILDLEEQMARAEWARQDFEARAGEQAHAEVVAGLKRQRAELDAALSAARLESSQQHAQLAAQAKALEERDAEAQRLERAVASLRHQVAELESENASYQEQVLEAYRRIEANGSTVTRAKKAVAIALTLLDEEEHKNREPNRHSANDPGDRPALEPPEEPSQPAAPTSG